MNTKQDSKFLETLVGDLAPKRWYSGRSTRVICWAAFVLIYVAFVVMVLPGPSFEMLLNSTFVVQTGGIIALAILCGVAAIVLSIPGEKLSHTILWLLGLTVVLNIYLLVSVGPEAKRGVIELIQHSGDASACSVGTVIWAILPALFGAWVLHKGAALNVGIPAFLVFLAAGFVGTAVLQFDCVNQQPLHVLLGHMFPAVVVGMVGLWGGKWLLNWNRRLRDKRQVLLKP